MSASRIADRNLAAAGVVRESPDRFPEMLHAGVAELVEHRTWAIPRRNGASRRFHPGMRI